MNFLARLPVQSRRTVTLNESCPSARGQRLPVVSASLRVRYRRSEISDQSVSIRRIDGNHRLALAERLVEDEIVPRKYVAPFCLLLLGSPENSEDDYAESLIFHTINSTALPLQSEHGLSLILGQNADYMMPPEREFIYDPALHLTRLLRDGAQGLPRPARDRLGPRPLTAFNDTARSLIAMEPALSTDITVLREFADSLIAALNDITTRLWTYQHRLVMADYFIDLVARVWREAEGETHDEQVHFAVNRLSSLGTWFGRGDLIKLSSSGTLSEQLLQIHNVIQERVPKRVFLARWYPTPEDGEHLTKANLRLRQVKQTLSNVKAAYGYELDLVDMGTQTGSTFPIHQEMYEAIASSDIILVDLTGLRPNVCIEAGYALDHHKKDRLIFLHHRYERSPEVSFDLKTFRYESFSEAAEIPEKLGPHIREILRHTSLNI